jgi:hypothetical protein
MKRFGWILVLLLATSPAWAAKKITVGQLEDLLHSLQQAKKTDVEVATALKQIELTEELTRKTMNSLVDYVPGPLSTEQIYVLEAESAMLAPPAADLPTTPAPDAAAQKAILDKAADYVTKTYGQLPHLTVTKTTLRFQDHVEALAGDSGIVGNAKEAVTTFGLSNPASYVHYINSTETQIESEHGAEKPPSEKDKTRWGMNRMITLREPDPSLSVIFQDAQAAGNVRWLRWELVNGGQAAVYSFAVPKKKSPLALNVCCFPNVSQIGVARFYNSMDASMIAGQEAAGGGGGGVTGNVQTTADWYNYKASVPYHGEFFIDPDTGIVVRMITEAEIKPSEVVHQVDTRIDYAPVSIGDKSIVLPVRTIINTEVVPNGDSGAARYATRRTLFTAEYKNYQLAGTHP